ncbi:MAG TPA: CotH kinase family protein [Kofleriaceae bacterium]|nr:CotH kinase family protein [Kofleriaceae bacterium]
MRRLALAATLAAALSAVAACTDPPPPEPAALPPPPQCAPTADGPYSLVEGDTLTFTLHCANAGETRTGDRFVIPDLPAGATYDPSTATVTWTPGLDQAAVFTLTLEVKDELISGRVKIAVADAFDTPGNVPPLDPSTYTEELGLPVLFLSPAPRSTNPEPVTVVYRGQTYAATAWQHGASSLGYPQLSYTIKLADGDHLSDPEHGGGFFGKRSLVLISTFDDNTYVRQRLAYELWRRMDPDHLVVHAYSAVLYVDGAFHGLYTITDHVDNNFMGDEGLPQDGNLYQAITHDANFDTVKYDGSGPKATLHDGYSKEAGTPPAGQPGAWTDVDDLVTFTSGASAADFAAQLPARFEVGDLRDWYVFVTYMLAEDSAGKNCFLMHDHDPAVGLWRYLPWDFNHSFGQAWQTYRTSATSWTDFRRNNRIFSRMLDDTTMAAALSDRYRAMLAGPLSDEQVLGLFDAMVAETAGVAARNERMWGQAYRTFSRWSARTDFLDHDDEVTYTRQWIQTRSAMIRARYATP